MLFDRLLFVKTVSGGAVSNQNSGGSLIAIFGSVALPSCG